jgi:hypothetical protein
MKGCNSLVGFCEFHNLSLCNQTLSVVGGHADDFLYTNSYPFQEE